MLLAVEVRAEATGARPEAKGCPFELSVRQVDRFIENRHAEMVRIRRPMLDGMREITSKAKKPGMAIGKQLSAEDIQRFNGLLHLLSQTDAEVVTYDKFQRDVHVIAETLRAAKLTDLYEVKKENLGAADPRRFYFTIHESLRLAQPKTFHSPLIEVGIDCDPEAGLFFEESFNQQELGSSGGIENQHLVDLIGDIERLRTFYQLIWMGFNKGVDDIRATTWNGDTPITPDSLSPAVSASSSSMQRMWKVIVPYIDKQMPSEKEFEMTYRKRFKADVESEFPSK